MWILSFQLIIFLMTFKAHRKNLITFSILREDTWDTRCTIYMYAEITATVPLLSLEILRSTLNVILKASDCFAEVLYATAFWEDRKMLDELNP